MDCSKILSIVLENLLFLDSLNYLPMSLKGISKSFNLTCKKRHYPHFFNTANNLDYVGSYPEPKLYGAHSVSVDERTQFLVWYKGVKDKIFNNSEELLACCLDDVNVVRQACCAFRNLFLELVKMDQLSEEGATG